MRIVQALIAIAAAIGALTLAGCGGGDAGNGATPVVSTTPVATAKPPAGKQWTEVFDKTGEGWVRQGNPAAPIKLVEYGSRSCPVCGAFAQTGVEPLRAKYIASGQVSYEFRDFLVHPQDLGIALLGRCASTEAFFPILDQMYANQTAFNQKLNTLDDATYQQMQKLTPLEQAKMFVNYLGYTGLMKQSGVTDAQIQQCMSQPALDVLGKQLEEATEVKKVSGTPTFFINDKQVEGAVGWAQLEPALQRAGAR
ncbi:MAG: thioredoxin domain-containing protein [Pseudomonadota bacterium]